MDVAQAGHFADALETNGARIRELAPGNLEALVPSCPGWVVEDLVGHLGTVFEWMTVTLGAGSIDRPSHRFVSPDTDDVVGWFGERFVGIVDALRSTDPSTPCWNWAGTGAAGFYHRRMAAESLVHRMDLERALDQRSAVDGDLAADAVDEAIAVGLQHGISPKRTFVYPEGTLHLHRTDGDGEWLLAPAGDGGLDVRREHAKGDAAVRGTGEELLWWIWGREGATVEVFGDEDLADAWTHVMP